MRFLKIIFILFPFFLFPFLLNGEVGKQVRIDVIPQWYSKDNIKVYGQISVRREFKNYDWIRYVLKPSIAYSLDDEWSLRGGLGLLYTDNKEINGFEIADRLEIRPFQGIKYNYIFNDFWSVNTYGRLEERFDFNTETEDSVNSLRFRLKVETIYKFDAYRPSRYYRAMASLEGFSAFTDVRHQTNEKFRFMIGLKRSFNHNQKGRIDISFERQDSSYSQVYLRLRYYPTWGTLFNKIRKQD